MADMMAALRAMADAARRGGFLPPVVRFQNWEDGMVLVVADLQPLPDEMAAVDGLHSCIVAGVRIEFPTRPKRGD